MIQRAIFAVWELLWMCFYASPYTYNYAKGWDILT